MTDTINLLDLVPDEAERILREFAVAQGEPAYRAAQVTRRLWTNPVPTFDTMSELPRAFRERLAQHAETSMRVIQLGLGAIGHLLTNAAVQVEDRTIPAESMESLGTLMAELSELASVCYELSLQSRGSGRGAE